MEAWLLNKQVLSVQFLDNHDLSGPAKEVWDTQANTATSYLNAIGLVDNLKPENSTRTLLKKYGLLHRNAARTIAATIVEKFSSDSAKIPLKDRQGWAKILAEHSDKSVVPSPGFHPGKEASKFKIDSKFEIRNSSLAILFVWLGVAALPVVLLIGGIIVEIGIAGAFVAYFLAQSGYGMRFSDYPATRANGGNCYACHQLESKELSFGTIGPSLTNYGKDRKYDAAEIKRAYTKIYDSQAELACSNMPRFGANGFLTEQQIKDIVALLFDPESPVNK